MVLKTKELCNVIETIKCSDMLGTVYAVQHVDRWCDILDGPQYLAGRWGPRNNVGRL